MRLEKVLETHVLLNGILEYFIEHSITFCYESKQRNATNPIVLPEICDISHFKLLNALIRLTQHMKRHEILG